MRKTIVTAVVVALVASVGTAGAAKLITGKDVLNGSLTGADVRNGSIASIDVKNGGIAAVDLSQGVRAQLQKAGTPGRRGATGAAGPAGAAGARGLTGATGATGARGLTGATGATGAAGVAGAKGDKGDKGDTGASPFTHSFSYTDRNDTSCFDTPSSQEIWATTDADRHFVVTAAQDGTGYFVTRYDIGTYTTIVGAQHARNGPCDTNVYEVAQTGPFGGVWTVEITGSFDYNPTATPADDSWGAYAEAVFDITGFDAGSNTSSYEFDYYNQCGHHWRDSSNGAAPGGFIGDCP